MDIKLITLASYVKPPIVENKTRNWVENGRKNSFYQYIIDRNNGSPTNASINNSYSTLIYGRGLSIKGSNEVGVKELEGIIKPKELRKAIVDFQVFNEFSVQIIKNRGKGLSEIKHVPKQLVLPSLKNEDGEIESYWYSENWSNTNKYRPQEFDAFGNSTEPIQIYVGKPYRVGDDYFTSPDYLSGLQYAEAEEEISNLNISSIKNGLSAGYIINIPDGKSWGDEEKEDFEKAVKKKLTTTSNASNFIISFNGRDVEITITPFPVNENIHKQWEFLTEEAKRQIMTSHRVISPSLVGLSSASGFSSVADEMDMSEKQTMKRVIKPKQEFIIESLEEILSANGINLELEFLPLTEEIEEAVEDVVDEVEEVVDDKVEMSTQINADNLIELGETIGDDWEVIDESRCDEITLKENQLNTIVEFAQTPKTSRKNSKQDTSLFKIRYKYAGDSSGERDFCNKVIQAGKVYREEDLNANYNYNEDFAPSGKSTYNIFNFKGGVNCKHFWQRVIYLKKGNDQISVNKARKLILELDPKERSDAKWEQNDKRVAQVAEPKNNWWSLKPNYRK